MPRSEAPHAHSPPTQARFVVLALLCSMAFVLYLDRVCIAQALKPIKTEFSLSNTQGSVILMAFTLAYGLFEIPTGRWGDRYGSRRVLTRIALWWSAFTALTGCVWKFSYEIGYLPSGRWTEAMAITFDSFILLVIIRFLFGAGEAGAFPNAARIMVHWFSTQERGRFQGLFQACSLIGGTVAPVMFANLIDAIGWRWTFGVFGVVGVVWAAVFYWWFRDDPAQHPSVNAAELAIIGQSPHDPAHRHDAVPWREVLSNRNIWLLSAITICTAFNSYVFFSWYPTYLQEARDVTQQHAGWLAAVALTGASLGSFTGGSIVDWVNRHLAEPYRARRWQGLVFFALAASCIVASVHTDSPLLSAVCCCLGAYLLLCQQSTWWACTFDVCGKHLGAVFGFLNGMGVIGAMGSQFFFGAFADWRGSRGYTGRDQWDPAFYVCGAVLLGAAVLWQLVRPVRPIGEPASPEGAFTPVRK